MQCKICSQKFNSIQKYVLHIEYIHKLSNYFCCPIERCERVFQRKDALKRHYVLSHDGSFKCTKYCKIKQNAYTTTETVTGILSNNIVCINNEAQSTDSNISCLHTAFTNNIEHSKAILLAKLYSNSNLTRKDVLSVISIFEEFLSFGIIDNIWEYFKLFADFFEEAADRNMAKESLKDMLEQLKSAFSNVKSEKQVIIFFELRKLFFKPSKILLGVLPTRSKETNFVKISLQEVYAYYLDIKKTLKRFLELPNVFVTIIEYQNKIENNSNILNNVVNSSLWLDIKKKYIDKIVVPCFLYFDDVEINNPLGSHAGCYKIGAVYFSIPIIPPSFASKLENIFLTLLFHSNDRKEFGNKATFNQMIADLKSLEETGLLLTINGQPIVVYVVPILILGDNLGVHSILGLCESFIANFFCRFCVSNNTETEIEHIEISSKLRKVKDYEEHLNNNLGVKEICIFNELENFHVYQNTSCDLMHDVFEGILRYDLAEIILYFVSNKFFTLEFLNEKIKYFNYAANENMPPPIKIEHLKKGYLIMSASEMLCFSRNFVFMVGNVIPENNEVWLFYLNLLQLLDLVTSSVISIDDLEYLKNIISEHNLLYKDLFGKSLKPKHHFLIHYPTIISKIGPPIYYSSIRFEGKHK